MDELLDWKHIVGPSPDLSTVVRQHATVWWPFASQLSAYIENWSLYSDG